MSGADRLEDSFPHGTADGYAQGCRGGYCPAGNDHGLSCRRAKQLAAGDYRFQRLVKQGLNPSELALEMSLTPETHTVPARTVTVPDDGEDDDTVDDREEEVVEQEVVAPEAPRVVRAPKPGKPAPTADDEKRRRAEIRKWAAEQGIQIGAKGRIPHAVVVGWLNDDPTLGGTIKPVKPKKRLGTMKPTVQPPALSEPVEHELAAVTTAVDATYPANDGSRVEEDPTHGRIDKDIQEHVDELRPSSLGQRVAIENTLQEQRDRGAASSEVPILSPEQQEAVVTAIVHGPVVPDMETRVELYNEGFASAEEIYGPVIGDLLRTEAALALALTKWGEEQQKRKDAELLARVLAVEVKNLERRLAIADSALDDVAQILRPADTPLTDAGVLHGSHVAARKPWWKRSAS